MNLSIDELIEKFPELSKFKDQKWMAEEAIKHDCNYKELPLKAAFSMIKDVIYFIDKTKFTSDWEEKFSVKIRLKQIEKLLSYFCEDTQEEKAIKGTDISPLEQDSSH